MIRLTWQSASEEETARLGAALGAALVPPIWIGLEGPLGAGKTRFAAGLAQGLGYRGRVRSPTFVLENRYSGRTSIRHLDLYRLEAPDEEMVASWDEDARSVIVVEWAERAAEHPERALRVRIEPIGSDGSAVSPDRGDPAASIESNDWTDDTRRWVTIEWEGGDPLLHDLRLEGITACPKASDGPLAERKERSR